MLCCGRGKNLCVVKRGAVLTHVTAGDDDYSCKSTNSPAGRLLAALRRHLSIFFTIFIGACTVAYGNSIFRPDDLPSLRLYPAAGLPLPFLLHMRG